jgi:hypothetical protein
MHLGKSDAEFQKILKAADGMRQMGNKAMQAAFARVPEDTKPEHVLEEGLAYYIEAHPKSTFTQRVRAWFRKALRKVGAAFAGSERFRVFAWANSLTENDLIQMAHDALLAADTTVIANNRSGTTVIDYGNKQDGAAVLAMRRWKRRSGSMPRSRRLTAAKRHGRRPRPTARRSSTIASGCRCARPCSRHGSGIGKRLPMRLQAGRLAHWIKRENWPRSSSISR